MSHDVIPTCIFIYNKKILPVKAVAAITPWFENRFNVKLNYIRWERTLDTGHDLVPETRVIARQFKYLYTGVTQNVPVDFPPPAAKPDRPPADSPKIAARGIHMPLLGVDKRAVMYLYRKFELMDLFELTNSCTKVCDVPCGECYHCQERNWALKVTEVL